MKTRILLSTIALGLVLVASSAEAGKRGHDPHGRSHGNAHYGYVEPHARHRHGRRHHQRHWSHGHHGHRGHHGHHKHGYEALAGALLLGTIVATLDRPRPAGVVTNGPAYIVRQPYSATQNIWYQRDVNGECFEVRLQHGGTQLWTRTHPSNCR